MSNSLAPPTLQRSESSRSLTPTTSIPMVVIHPPTTPSAVASTDSIVVSSTRHSPDFFDTTPRFYWTTPFPTNTIKTRAIQVTNCLLCPSLTCGIEIEHTYYQDIYTPSPGYQTLSIRRFLPGHSPLSFMNCWTTSSMPGTRLQQGDKYFLEGYGVVEFHFLFNFEKNGRSWDVFVGIDASTKERKVNTVVPVSKTKLFTRFRSYLSFLC